MSLKNDGSRMFDFNGNVEISSIVLFAQAERRLKAKKDLIDDLQNEYNLLNRQAFELYKTHVNYWKLDPSLISKSGDWLTMKHKGVDAEGNKLDGRKKYPEKEIYEYFTDLIKGYLDIDDFEITGFIDFNFGQAKDIVFTSHNHKWYLEVPMVSNMHMESYNRYGDGCFKLSLHHYDSEHCTSNIGSTFDEEQLKDLMTKGLEKYCGENKNEMAQDD